MPLLQTRAILSLGGNLGDVSATITQALAMLDEHPDVHVEAISHNYDTTPVGSVAGNRYINAAALLSTTLAPHALLDALQRVEEDHHRERSVRWGPRTLDLDLIAFGDQIISTERLIVPHPACFYRRFVLDPVVEIAPDWNHPLLEMTFSQLRDELLKRPLRVGVSPETFPVASLRRTFSHEVAEFVSITDSSAALVLTTSLEDCSDPRCVLLEKTSALESTATQILIAATDSPKRL